MNQNSIITLRNYASHHIYNIVEIHNSKLDPKQKQLKLQSIFKELINNIRFITNTNELDVHNTPMPFIFQHIRQNIIQLVANCKPNIDKLFIEKGLLYNYDWNLRFFKALKILNAKDIMVWFFFHVPYYNENTNNIIKQREIYSKMIEYFLINWTPDLYFTEKEFVFLSNQTCMPYAISYHDKNNVNILTKYHHLIRKICPWVNYYSPYLAERVLKKKKQIIGCNGGNGGNNKIKICFISDSFTTDTSVLRDRISIIGKLDRTKYEVYFASFYPFEEIHGIIAKVFMKNIKSNYIYLGNNLTIARNTLDKYGFDFIVYPDIGMKLYPTLLAYSRIAPVQITTWGHSETSGIDTIDYFISSEYFEKDYSISQTHYSEKLILLKSLGTYYISPHILFVDNHESYIKGNKQFKSRKQFGFLDNTQIQTTHENLYVCLQTFYKLTPEFEICISRILELDPNGIVLLSNTFPFCKSHLIRMKKNIGIDKLKRLRWFGSLEKDEFLNLVSISDVCLDPFPFGGCNTSYDAFAYNIPVITMTGDYLHGRFTYGLYKKMGIYECIANNVEEYAQLASNIGTNEKLRHKINRNIEMRKHLIFQEQESVNEWNELFDKLKEI